MGMESAHDSIRVSNSLSAACFARLAIPVNSVLESYIELPAHIGSLRLAGRRAIHPGRYADRFRADSPMIQ
ncbi:MAG: hypothetical protein AMXMBFR82_06200 [Candidatus Hydrogenedentota bacterium]